MIAEFDIRKTQLVIKEALKEINEIAIKNNVKYYIHAGTVLGAVRHNGFIPWDFDADIIVPITHYKDFIKSIKDGIDDSYEVRFQDSLSMRNQAVVCVKNHPEIMVIDIFPMVGICSENKRQDKYVKKCKCLKNLLWNRQCVNRKSDSKIKSLIKVIIRPALEILTLDKIYRLFDSLCIEYDYTTSTYVTNPCGGYGKKNIIEKRIYGTPVYHEFSGLSLPLPEETEYYLTHYYGDYKKYPPKKIQDFGYNRIVRVEMADDEYKKLNKITNMEGV